MSRQNDGFEFKFLLLQKVLSAFFRVVNVFVRWDRLGYLIGAVNIATLRDRLRRDNLHHAGYGVQAATPWMPGNERWRSADGSYNSLRSEEHTSELQSLRHLVCRLLLE